MINFTHLSMELHTRNKIFLDRLQTVTMIITYLLRAKTLTLAVL